MIHYRSEEEIDLIRESSLLVAKTHAEISALVKPGVTTLQLDTIAEEIIRDNGGVPAFKGYGGFPNTLCASLNEQVVHGIPNDKPLNDGDIISMDCGVVMNGYYGDSAYTYEVGYVPEEVKNLLIRTKESLYYYRRHQDSMSQNIMKKYFTKFKVIFLSYFFVFKKNY